MCQAGARKEWKIKRSRAHIKLGLGLGLGYPIFFIHSSVYGHLDCFYVLAIVNNAAMNTGMHVSFLN